jgi:hypothetical protein
VVALLMGAGLEAKRTSVRSPWQSGLAESAGSRGAGGRFWTRTEVGATRLETKFLCLRTQSARAHDLARRLAHNSVGGLAMTIRPFPIFSRLILIMGWVALGCAASAQEDEAVKTKDASANNKGGPWKNKRIEQWTPEDAKQVLADSPWVKSVQLQIVRDLSPDERRMGGNMEADMGKGIGLSGLTGVFSTSRANEAIARAHAKPDPGKVVVHWETARPVRAAEALVGDKDAPEVADNYYAVVVYDVLTPKRWNIERELRGIAALKLYKEKDLKPARVVIIRKDPEDERANVVYLFPRSVEITKKDPWVGFHAQIDRLVIWQPFYPQEMQIQGQLEL